MFSITEVCNCDFPPRIKISCIVFTISYLYATMSQLGHFKAVFSFLNQEFIGIFFKAPMTVMTSRPQKSNHTTDMSWV